MLVYKEKQVFRGTAEEAKAFITNLVSKRKKYGGDLKKYLEEILTSVKKFENIYKVKYVRPKGLFEKLSRTQVLNKYGNNGVKLFDKVEKEWNLLQETLKSGNEKMKHVLVSGMIDNKTGEVSKIFSNFTKGEIKLGKHLDFINELHPTLKKRLDEHLKKVGKNGLGLNLEDPDVYKFAWKDLKTAHAEFRALDDLLKKIDKNGEIGEAIFDQILGYNSFLKKPGIQHTCADCFYLTYGVTYIK